MAARAILSAFSQVINSNFIKDPTCIRLPLFDSATVETVVKEAMQSFANDPVLLQLKSPIFIIGDLHGSFFDLAFILKCFGMPPVRSYLFMGSGGQGRVLS